MQRKRGGWKIKKTVVRYRNPWIKVREDHGMRPDGKPGYHTVVEMVPGISALPIDGQGNVFLVREFQYAISRFEAKAVSGIIDHDETPVQAARREIEEELGIRANKMISLGVVNPFTAVVLSPAYLFIAKELKLVTTRQEGTERVTRLKVPLAKAVKMVMQSQITHGPSCVLILKAHEYLKNKPRGSIG